MELCKLTVTDLYAMLKDRGVLSGVVDAFQSNSVNRDVLEALTEEEIKELASKLSDRVDVRSRVANQPLRKEANAVYLSA